MLVGDLSLLAKLDEVEAVLLDVEELELLDAVGLLEESAASASRARYEKQNCKGNYLFHFFVVVCKEIIYIILYFEMNSWLPQSDGWAREAR